MIRLLVNQFVMRDREGSSLISVVIGVLFLAAIGLIVLTTANQYMISVNVDHNSANNFYDAEAILEEVKTGLLEYAGDAGEEAYRYVLENYAKDKNSKREIFSKKFLTLLATKLQSSGAGAFVWDDEKIGKAQPASIDKLKVLSNVPEAVTLKKGSSELAFVIRKDETTGEYSLVIRNMMINYTDEIDYRTSIQTDLCLSVPDYSLEGNALFDEMKDYISISDNSLEVAKFRTGNTIQGNVYSGNEKQGILLDQESGVNFKSSMIVSRGDLEMHNGAKASLSGETGNGDLYLKNIHLTGDIDSTLPTELTLHENAYIANDLNIETNQSRVTLGGKYYGYSYNEKNLVSSSAVVNSDYSSAILINGRNTTLGTDNLKSLVLAGRAFVSRENADKTKPVSDIMMGESIAVKSNQLAYLVPDEFITAEAGYSDEYSNPVFKADSDKVKIDVDGLKAKFGEYLADTDQPYEKNYNNDIGYVFYYLKFKNENAANEYFKAYYNGKETEEDGDEITNKDELREKGKVYISNQDLGIKFDQTLYLLAGNVMNNYYGANGANLQTANYFGSGQTPNTYLLEEGRRMGQNYVGRQLGLTPAKNTTGAMRLPAAAAPMVSSTILDFDNPEFNSKVPNVVTVKGEEETKVEGAVLCISKEDYTITNPMTGLLIVKGDVTVQSDFTGLILATGKVTVDRGSVNMTSDMITVGKLFDYIRTDDSLVPLFRELNGTSKKRPDNLAECISYQNWIKNSY